MLLVGWQEQHQLCSFKFPIVLCELCFVLHFHSFIVPLAVLFVDLVHSILLFALRLSRPSCNQVVSDCFWNIKLTYLLTYSLQKASCSYHNGNAIWPGELRKRSVRLKPFESSLLVLALITAVPEILTGAGLQLSIYCHINHPVTAV